MDYTELITNLKLFRDKAFSHHSHYKAGQLWRLIAKEIHPDYYQKISIEWSHVQLGHGREQACAALDTEVKKYINFLENI